MLPTTQRRARTLDLQVSSPPHLPATSSIANYLIIKVTDNDDIIHDNNDNDDVINDNSDNDDIINAPKLEEGNTIMCDQGN